MSCLGGTPDEPRIWHRYRYDSTTGAVYPERVDGRICTRTNPRTSRNGCAGCVAFRGLKYGAADEGPKALERVVSSQVVNGLVGGNGQPYALSDMEHRQYQDAINGSLTEAELMDWLLDHDEPPPGDGAKLALFYSRMEREFRVIDGSRVVVSGMGKRTLRSPAIGDPLAMDLHAEDMRRWRADHPGADKRKRAAYMRGYRARQKAGDEK